MTHADGKETVGDVPWRDAGEKETTLALVRALMRAGTRAWAIVRGR